MSSALFVDFLLARDLVAPSIAISQTPPTTPCTLGQSNSNPSLQMVATKRKALDQEEEDFSANKAARIEAEPEEAVVVWKPPTTRATSKRNSTEKWISAVKPIHTKKKPPLKKKLQNKRLPSDDNKKKQF